MKEYKAAYYAANRERLRKKQNEYSATHKKEIRERNVKAYWADPKKSQAAAHTWRTEARKKTPLEKHVEERLCTEVERRGGMCPKFVDPSRRGAPDRMVLLPGHPTYFVELKRPKSFGELRSWQIRYHDDIRAAGQKVWVLWGDADVDAFLLELDLCL